jgi:hypothetical protein
MTASALGKWARGLRSSAFTPRRASAHVPVFPLWGTADGGCECGKGDCQSPGKHPLGALVPNRLHEVECRG